MKKLFLSIFIALSMLSAKAQTDSDNWGYSESFNEMTSETTYYASTADRSQKVTAGIMVKYKSKTNFVMLTVTNGIFNAGVDGIFFKARFDDSNIEGFSGSIPSDGSFDTIFIDQNRKFLKKLKAAKVVFIQIPIYDQGTYTFKFNTEGLNWSH